MLIVVPVLSIFFFIDLNSGNPSLVDLVGDGGDLGEAGDFGEPSWMCSVPYGTSILTPLVSFLSTFFILSIILFLFILSYNADIPSGDVNYYFNVGYWDKGFKPVEPKLID